jgi:hypothetical protein
MSKLLSTSDTIKKLARSGVEEIEFDLFLFHRMENRVVRHKVVGGADYGFYYVEGNVEEFISGYSEFIVDGRTLGDENIFSINTSHPEYGYDSNSLCTVLPISSNSTYFPNVGDVGFCICGKYRATDDVKSLINLKNSLFEEGSLGNTVASEFNFEINDESRVFYNRTNRSGLFYVKDTFSEVYAINGESRYAFLNGVSSSYLKLKHLDKYFVMQDFVNGYLEVLTGKAAGAKFVINSANGYNVEVLGYVGKNYARSGFGVDILPGDKIRLFKANKFWYRLDMWVRSEVGEKVAVACGKLDLSTVKVNDKERFIAVTAYSSVKDLMDKGIGDLNFENGNNLERLREVKPLFLSTSGKNDVKALVRSEVEDNPLHAITVKQVGYDVADGWHSLDFHPFGNLFRFDYGKWHQVVDEGSFEKSTNQVFIASCPDSVQLSKYARTPAHDGMWRFPVVAIQNTPPVGPGAGQRWVVGSSPTGAWADHADQYAKWVTVGWSYSEPSFGDRVLSVATSANYIWDGAAWTEKLDLVNNIYMERNWNGLWCSIEIPTEEQTFVNYKSGLLGGSDTPAGWKKLSGLPKVPCRIWFKVEEDKTISKQVTFQYSFGNSSSGVPVVGFDYIQEWNHITDAHYRDVTYLGNTGTKWDRNASQEVGLFSTGANRSLRCWSFDKFYGVKLDFDASAMTASLGYGLGYSNFISTFFNSLQVRFSKGEGEFTDNLGIRYTGGILSTGINKGSFTLTIAPLSTAWDGNYTKIANMKIICVSGSNFLAERVVNTVSQSGSDLDKLVITTKSDFENNLSTDDMFVIVNKNFNVKFYDNGDSFKDGKVADLIAVKIWDKTYLDLKHSSPNTMLNTDIKNGDQLLIGNREKFGSVFVTLNSADLESHSWSLRTPKFLVECWDGYNWKGVKNVNILPVNVQPLNDIETATDKDDRLKYVINFESDNWSNGADWDEGLWSSPNGVNAPSTIDPNELFVVRVSMIMEMSVKLLGMGIGGLTELSAAVMWDEIDSWKYNLVEMKGGNLAVDTLKVSDVGLSMYGVEVVDFLGGTSYRVIRKAVPVNRIIDDSGNKLFFTIAPNNIQESAESDVVVISKDHPLGFKTIPKNISFHYLMERILKDSKLNNSDFKLYKDSYNSDKRVASILGSNYDGVHPFEPGWDLVLKTEKISEHFNLAEWSAGIDTCSIRDNGIYRMYVVLATRVSIVAFSSTDMKNWYSDAGIVANLGTKEILSVEVIKNRNEENYCFFITYRDNSSSTYKIGYISTTNPLQINMNNVVDIVVDSGDNMGKCSVVFYRGKSSDTADCGRYMCVERYEGTGITDGIPTGDVSLHFYDNSGTITNAWTKQADELDGFNNPVFVKANYGVTTSLAMNFTLLCMNSSNLQLYKALRDNSGSAPWPWESPVLVNSARGSVPITGMSCLNDGMIYRLNNSESDNYDASTLIPSTPDVFLLSGISGGNVTGIVVNLSCTDWNDEAWWSQKTGEFNNWDWFKTEKNVTVLDRADSATEKNNKVYLGFRKPFNKIDCFASDKDFTKHLQARYWNGKEWLIIPTIYQDGDIITTGKFHINYGLVFIPPSDWVAESFGDTVGSVFVEPLDQNFQALYWVEISLGSWAAAADTVMIKKLENCFTSLFLTQGRNVFYMDNWNFVKHIYSYDKETHKNIKLDSFSPDYQDKTVVMNVVEDGTYGYKVIENLVFDMFGRFHTANPLWENELSTYGNNPYVTMDGKPTSIFRKGKDHSFEDGEAVVRYGALIGTHNEDFLSFIYDSGTHAPTGTASVGFNVPVPFNQKVRKYSIEGNDWVVDVDDFFNKSQLNNIVIARREGILEFPSNLDEFDGDMKSLVASLSSTGLLHEELINKPLVWLEPGFYAFMEKSYLDREDYIDYEVLDSGDAADADFLLAVWNSNPGEYFLITSGFNANYLIWQDGVTAHKVKPQLGGIIHVVSDDKYYRWDGINYLELTDTAIWNGRNDTLADGDKGIGLEWSLGQEGVYIPYFRPLNSRPVEYMNNNVVRELDYKVVHNYRAINLTVNGPFSFGVDVWPRNYRVTCAVELPDLSAIKNSDSSTDADQKYMEPNACGMAFGVYGFRDVDMDAESIPTRWDSGTDAANPLSVSALCMYKAYGKVKNWETAFFYDSSAATYTDIAAALNYKDRGNNLVFAAGDYIYLGSSSKFFGLTLGKLDDLDLGNLTIEYKNDYTGFWVNAAVKEATTEVIPNKFSQYRGTDDWGKKTLGYVVAFDPFAIEWTRSTVNSIADKYWVRIKCDNPLAWVIQSGAVIWDNTRWWEYITIESELAPIPPYTQVQYGFFDTFVPMTLEYDPEKKKLLGSMWNYDASVNKHYPFTLQFDPIKIQAPDYDLWSWEMEYLNIRDKAGDNYNYTIKSMKMASGVDTVCLMLNENKDKSVVALGVYKNYCNGDTLFAEDLT